MNEIRSLIANARRRLETSRYFSRVHVVAFVAALLALALVNAERVGASLFIPWVWVGPALAGVSLLSAWLWWLRGRPNELQIAIEVDERLDLREKLSTALHCQGREDTFAMAALQDAVETARRPQTREQIARRFPITAPGRWYVTPLIVFLAFMMSFIAPLDLFGREEATIDPAQAVNMTSESVDAVVEEVKQQTGGELSPEIEELLNGLNEAGMVPEELSGKEDIKREAIRNLSELNRKLEEMLEGEKGKTGEALERALKPLEPPSDGLAKEFAENLAGANFEGAQQALKEMIEKMEAGELNEEQKKQLAEQMENIAEQLEELAKQAQQLQDALKQAGLDPQLAQNPQALQQALQNNQNLNQEQKQQLQQMAQAQQAMQQMMQGMGQACQGMGQAMQNGQMGQMAQAGNQMQQQLGQMEQLQQMLMQAQAAMKACQGQCQGLGQGLAMAMSQWSNKQGNGMGNQGQGRGGKAPLAPTPHQTAIEKAKVETTAGDIIGKTKVQGPQWVGESNAKVNLIDVDEILESYDEAITEDQLPRKYHETQQHYFGELKKQVETIRQAAEQTQPAGGEAPPNGSDGAAGSGAGEGAGSNGETGAGSGETGSGSGG